MGGSRVTVRPENNEVFNGDGSNVNSFHYVNGIKCLYTNADCLHNKIDELRTRVQMSNPHVIFISEVKPKRAAFDMTPAELRIDGYNLFHNSLKTGDGTRGCLVYVIKSISAHQVETDDAFPDSALVEIKLIGGDKLLLGCIYRSPNSMPESNAHLCRFLVNISNMRYSHLLICGDFNFPKIDWGTWTSNSENDEGANFIEALRDGYLYQHIRTNTRTRGNQEPSLIDLVLTNEQNMVDNIETQSPLGKSDHTVINFDYKCYNIQPHSTQRKMIFHKGNYDQMRKELATFDWDSIVKTGDTVNTQWENFSSTLQQAMQYYIPKQSEKMKSQKRFLTPLDNNSVRKIKRNHRAWEKFMRTRESEDYRSFCKLRNQVRRLTKNARVDYEKQIGAE